MNVQDLSQSVDAQQEYLDDPLNFPGNVRCRTANETLGGMRGLQREYGKFAMPVYGQHGEKDVVTSVAAHKKFHAAMPSQACVSQWSFFQNQINLFFDTLIL